MSRISVTWLIKLGREVGRGGQNRPWVLGTLIYKGVQVETGGKIGWN